MNPEMSELLQYFIVGGLVLLALIFLVNLIRKISARKNFLQKKTDVAATVVVRNKANRRFIQP